MSSSRELTPNKFYGYTRTEIELGVRSLNLFVMTILISNKALDLRYHMSKKTNSKRLKLYLEGAASILDLSGNHSFNIHKIYNYNQNIKMFWYNSESYFGAAFSKFEGDKGDELVATDLNG